MGDTSFHGRFQGTMTALVTPFRDGKVDDAALVALIEAQLAGGIDALVACGTTGEATTMSAAEQAQVIALTVRTVKRRVPVIAGAGSNSTSHAIELSHAARAAGVDGLLHVTPYYNRPSQEGCFRHFEAIAKSTPLPIIVYNVPGRTNVDLLPETLERLTAFSNIVAVKEATGSVARASAIHARLGERMPIFCGDDATNYPAYCVGAVGTISVVSNVAPGVISECWDAHHAGDAKRALAAHEKCLPLCDALFADTNPIPVKAALALLKRMSPEIRLPLYELSGAPLEALRKALAQAGLS